MRIGLVNEFYPPFAPGGAEWSMYELGKALVRRRHDVIVITPNYGASSFEIDAGVRVHRFWFPKRLKGGRNLPGFLWHANLFFYLYSAFVIWLVAKKENLEILHAQNKYSLAGTFLAARLLRIPVLCSIRDTSHICRIAVCLHEHESAPRDCGYQKLMRECSKEYYDHYCAQKSLWTLIKNKICQTYHWLDVHLRRFFLNRVDAVIGVSEGILRVYENSRVFNRSNVRKETVYNFVADLEKCEIADDDLRKKYSLGTGKIVLYVGGFSRGKGTEVFIDAVRKLPDEMSGVVAVMIGSGTTPHLLKPIHVLSNLDHAEVLQFYKLASVVVVPSTCQESLSRVILEAMAHGKPVVATRVGGSPEAVSDRINGFVVERKDSDALAGAIGKILNNPDLAKTMGRNAQEKTRTTFNRETVIAKIERIYKELIDARKGAANS